MILAFDPGKTTGWAAFSTGAGPATLLDAGECTTSDELYEVLERYDTQVVIVENFRIRPRGAPWQEVIAAERIGALEYICKNCLPTKPTFIRQEPSQRLQIRSEVCRSEHARDAVGHGVAYLLKHGYDSSYLRRLVEGRR